MVRFYCSIEVRSNSTKKGVKQVQNGTDKCKNLSSQEEGLGPRIIPLGGRRRNNSTSEEWTATCCQHQSCSRSLSSAAGFPLLLLVGPTYLRIKSPSRCTPNRLPLCFHSLPLQSLPSQSRTAPSGGQCRSWI